MTVEEMKTLLAQARRGRQGFLKEAAEGFSYYANENGILGRREPLYERQRKEEARSPLRFADNRIPHNFHRLLVNQKAGYFCAWAPGIDVGDDAQNLLLHQRLGGLDSILYRLSVDASNCGEGWLHYWTGAGGKFCFDRIDPREIFPVWNNRLQRELRGVLRSYRLDGVLCHEYWDGETVSFFQGEGDTLTRRTVRNTWKMHHHMGRVPFLLFANNTERRGDLPQYRALIDLYDQVVSGFANDLEDIQQVVFVLRNYGGTDLESFLRDLKHYKAVRVEGGRDEGGLDTLRIEIPTQARVALLSLLQKEIFVAGQGVNPFEEQIGNTSGVALKFRYNQLELKAMEQERAFSPAIRSLVLAAAETARLTLREPVNLNFTRNAIRSAEEDAAIAKESGGILSRYTQLANHPWVENPEAELKRIKKEEKELRGQTELL